MAVDMPSRQATNATLANIPRTTGNSRLNHIGASMNELPLCIIQGP